jgi:hypothetical protein
MANVINMPIRMGVLADLAPASAPPALSKQSPFYGVERGEEIAGTYRAHDTRAAVGKAIHSRGGKEVLSLIHEAIDSGILKPTGAATKKPTLRVLIPDGPVKYCAQFNLMKQKQRAHIRDVLWPIVLANKEAVIANPGNLEAIVNGHKHKQVTAIAAAMREEETARKVVESWRSGEHECIMFGVRLWPRMDNHFGSYDYDQVRAAAWYFRDFNEWMSQSRIGQLPGSRAIYARLSVKWFGEYLVRAYSVNEREKMQKVFSLVRTIAGLLDKAPDAECIYPVSPKVEGQW